MREMLFIRANASWPKGEIWSTARRGDKWATAKPGDVLDLMETESRRHLGRATVVGVRVGTFNAVCDTAVADKNHAIVPGLEPIDATIKLAADLKAAYGDIATDEPFTVVSLIAHNPEGE